MAQQKKQAIIIGNTDGKAPVLANAKQNTADGLKPSPASIEGGRNVTKPVSEAEALSLWQTACFDLQSRGFKTAILVRDNRIFMVIVPPASIGKLSYRDNHIMLDGVPVSEL